jgi:hypothetical protein
MQIIGRRDPTEGRDTSRAEGGEVSSESATVDRACPDQI